MTWSCLRQCKRADLMAQNDHKPHCSEGVRMLCGGLDWSGITRQRRDKKLQLTPACSMSWIRSGCIHHLQAIVSPIIPCRYRLSKHLLDSSTAALSSVRGGRKVVTTSTHAPYHQRIYRCRLFAWLSLARICAGNSLGWWHIDFSWHAMAATTHQCPFLSQVLYFLRLLNPHWLQIHVFIHLRNESNCHPLRQYSVVNAQCILFWFAFSWWTLF